MSRREVLRHKMVKMIYPRDWEQLRLACRQNAGYTCRHCGIKDGTIQISKRSGRPSILYLHAAHLHSDIDNPTPQLIALCPRCHMKYDRQQTTGSRRAGYGKLISTDNLARAVHKAGLIMWVENDGLYWQCNHLHGTASDPLDSVVQALSFLQMVPADTKNNK